MAGRANASRSRSGAGFWPKATVAKHTATVHRLIVFIRPGLLSHRVLHTRHTGHARHFSVPDAVHDVVVLVRVQHAYKRHHALHVFGPAGRQAVSGRAPRHVVHVHHGAFHECVLWKAGHLVRMRADTRLHIHAWHVGVLRRQRTIHND